MLAALCHAFQLNVLSKSQNKKLKGQLEKLRAPSVNNTSLTKCLVPSTRRHFVKKKVKKGNCCQNINLKTWKILAGPQI